jgi:hypothetical protein
MLDVDSWRFVHAPLDQGFFYHMYRLRNRLGADLRVVCSLRMGEDPTAGYDARGGGLSAFNLLPTFDFARRALLQAQPSWCRARQALRESAVARDAHALQRWR